MQKLELRTDKRIEVGDRILTPIFTSTNYTNSQIDCLFDSNIFTRIAYKGKAKKLFNLKLSFDDSKYLLKNKKLTVDEICCIKDLEIDVDLIKTLNCSKEVLLNEIPRLIRVVGGVDNLKKLLELKLSVDEIRNLFYDLKLSYDDTISMLDYGYKKSEIVTFVKNKYSCKDIILLARIASPSVVCSLYQECKGNIDFLISIKNILIGQGINYNLAIDCHNTLYKSIPTELCDSLVNSTKAIVKKFNTHNVSNNINPGYEEILMYYMDMAGGNMPVVVSAVPTLFVVLEKMIKWFKPNYSKFIDEYIPVKPFILASIWLSLDISLGVQYMKTLNRINPKEMARSVLAFLISSMCGMTGYFHLGGMGLPFPNVTNFISTYYNVQKTVEKKMPKLYKMIPKRLIFSTPECFDKLMKEKQIDSVRALSMVYTYRVGNAYLCSILGNKTFSSKVSMSIFQSLWPLPQEVETLRMYLIYSGLPIYSNSNLREVFVTI